MVDEQDTRRRPSIIEMESQPEIAVDITEIGRTCGRRTELPTHLAPQQIFHPKRSTGIVEHLDTTG